VVTDTATQTLTNKTLTSPVTAGTPTGVGVLTSGTAVASTSGTAIDFTSIPSWVKRITVMFSGVSTNGSSNLQIQLGDSGGIETNDYLGSISTLDSAVVSGNYTSGFLITNGTGSANSLHGAITISNISANTFVANGIIAKSETAGTRTIAGSKALSATLDRIRITTVNGTDTFDAGSINILFE
jgi:hypothetical protein